MDIFLHFVFVLFLEDKAFSKDPIVQISTGGSTCVLFESARIKCWGQNFFGEAGVGDKEAREDQPGEMGDSLAYVDLGTQSKPVQVFTSGGFNACALFANNKVKCWGINRVGQLGLGDQLDRGYGKGELGDALPFLDLGEDVVDLALGASFTCALHESQRVKCWGMNRRGQLGLGDKKDRGGAPGDMGKNLAYLDFGPGETVQSVVAGHHHACVLLHSGSVKCWGVNQNGQLGLGDAIDRGGERGQMGVNLPAVDLGVDSIQSIAAGAEHSCMLTKDKKLKCWGSNYEGLLGIGDTLSRGDNPNEMGKHLPFVNVGGVPIQKVLPGGIITCALLINNALKCWGSNYYFGLGVRPNAARIGDSEADMGKNLPFVYLGKHVRIKDASVYNATCILDQEGHAKCWGYNSWGALGLGHKKPIRTNFGVLAKLPFVDLGKSH